MQSLFDMSAGFGIIAILYLAFVLAVAVLGLWITVLLIKVLQLKSTELKLRIARKEEEPPWASTN